MPKTTSIIHVKLWKWLGLCFVSIIQGCFGCYSESFLMKIMRESRGSSSTCRIYNNSLLFVSHRIKEHSQLSSYLLSSQIILEISTSIFIQTNKLWKSAVEDLWLISLPCTRRVRVVALMEPRRSFHTLKQIHLVGMDV